MNALELRGLTKTYGDFTLDRLDLTLPTGCILGLVGENGAGKTTAIRLALGMERPDAGTVTLLGRGHEDLSAVKEELGVVLDEVEYPSGLTARQLGRVFAGIYRRWDPEAYAQWLVRLSVPQDKVFADLSRGMKMKLGLAAALSHHARLLILDEATNGLDPVVRDEVMDLLSEFTRDEANAVLISSHIVGDLEKICDHIAFLHRGQLMLCEEKDALVEAYGLLRCTGEQLRELAPGAVLFARESAYGAQAVVRRDGVPAGMELGPVTLEEIFIAMVKGEDR